MYHWIYLGNIDNYRLHLKGKTKKSKLAKSIEFARPNVSLNRIEERIYLWKIHNSYIDDLHIWV